MAHILIHYVSKIKCVQNENGNLEIIIIVIFALLGNELKTRTDRSRTNDELGIY